MSELQLINDVSQITLTTVDQPLIIFDAGAVGKRARIIRGQVDRLALLLEITSNPGILITSPPNKFRIRLTTKNGGVILDELSWELTSVDSATGVIRSSETHEGGFRRLAPPRNFLSWPETGLGINSLDPAFLSKISTSPTSPASILTPVFSQDDTSKPPLPRLIMDEILLENNEALEIRLSENSTWAVKATLYRQFRVYLEA